jgi:hypothetical protein
MYLIVCVSLVNSNCQIRTHATIRFNVSNLHGFSLDYWFSEHCISLKFIRFSSTFRYEIAEHTPIFFPHTFTERCIWQPRTQWKLRQATTRRTAHAATKIHSKLCGAPRNPAPPPYLVAAGRTTVRIAAGRGGRAALLGPARRQCNQ